MFGGKYSNKFCKREPNIFYEIELFDNVNKEDID